MTQDKEDRVLFENGVGFQPEEYDITGGSRDTETDLLENGEFQDSVEKQILSRLNGENGDISEINSEVLDETVKVSRIESRQNSYWTPDAGIPPWVVRELPESCPEKLDYAIVRISEDTFKTGQKVAEFVGYISNSSIEYI